MQQRVRKTPGPDHPITIEPAGGVVVVRSGDTQIARSETALALSEASYEIVYYVPRDDVDMDRLKPGSKETYCPYKGDATHFDVEVDGQVLENAAWSYQGPFEEMTRIDGHIAFYRNMTELELQED